MWRKTTLIRVSEQRIGNSEEMWPIYTLSAQCEVYHLSEGTQQLLLVIMPNVNFHFSYITVLQGST